MSFFSGIGKLAGNIGGTIKKAVVDTGHAVGKVANNKYTQMAAAAALAATGVGAPAAAGIMAGMAGGGKLLAPGGNIGDALKSGAKAGVTSYGVGKLAGAIPGAGKLASKIPGAEKVLGAGGANLPEQIVFDGAGNIVPQAASHSLGGTILGGLKSVGKFALDNPDLIAGGLAGVSGFKAGQQSDDLRTQAIQAMSERPDLSSIFADPGNPYNRYAQKPKAAGRLAA